jgi:N-acetylglucosaminyldiphosphoundecaprenol N-acetyl-beta-D-mannosaminyltransferase
VGGSLGWRRPHGPGARTGPHARAVHVGGRAGWSSSLYGAAEGVPELLAKGLAVHFPGLLVPVTMSLPFRPLTPEEDAAVIERINAATPGLVWVGLSTPNQERSMAAHVGRLTAPVLLGVGAVFDIHTGLLPQAAKWMQAAGLEWLYRLAREPRRLWGRYLHHNARFLLANIRQRPSMMVADW